MAQTYSDFLRTRAHQLRQPAPLLTFYELALPDGTFERYVDFADRDAGGSLPRMIPFNGVEFAATHISRGDLQESADGGAPTLPVSLYDFGHRGAYLLRTFGGLAGQRVTLWIAAYDNLARPQDAFQQDFEIINATISQGPDTVSFLLGHPNLYEIRIPRTFYDRRKCGSPYQDRFTEGAICNYPSNEFSAQTKEDFRARAEYGDQVRRHGWKTSGAARATTFDSHISNTGCLTIASVAERIAWKGRERWGPAFYRVLTGDLDVETQMAPVYGVRPVLTGLYIQSDVPPPDPSASEDLPALPVSSWVIWGPRTEGLATLAARVTTASLTASDLTTASADTFLRLTRTGTAIALYSKAAAADAWTLRRAVNLVLPASVRVGLLLSSDVRSENAYARYLWLRFNAGGLPTCKKTYEDCLAHDNTVQFGGYREMPSDRAAR